MDSYSNSDLVMPDNEVQFDNGIRGNRMILEEVSTDFGVLKCKGTPNSNPSQGNSDELTSSIDEWKTGR
jgi:hypothetical protein